MELEEKMNPQKVDLSSFGVKDTLNPKIFDDNGKMDKRVRKNLLIIADDYFENLDLGGVDYDDVTLTGSLANYNWSEFSDIDLHILLDYNDVSDNYDLVSDFFKAHKSVWNDAHDIKMHGFDVEIYAQDTEEEHFSTGVYSVLNDKWIVEPLKQMVRFDDDTVKLKVASFMDSTEDLYDLMGKKEYVKVINGVKKLKDKIKKMRQSGLSDEGEFSVENIVFKTLRRNGTLDRLYDLNIVAYDKMLTIENKRYL